MTHATLLDALFNAQTLNERAQERRRRIQLSLWAYAYEFENVSIVNDATFDKVAKESRPDLITGRLDNWWRMNFTPHTGSWVQNHPELDNLKQLYTRITWLRSKSRRGR